MDSRFNNRSWLGLGFWLNHARQDLLHTRYLSRDWLDWENLKNFDEQVILLPREELFSSSHSTIEITLRSHSTIQRNKKIVPIVTTVFIIGEKSFLCHWKESTESFYKQISHNIFVYWCRLLPINSLSLMYFLHTSHNNYDL